MKDIDDLMPGNQPDLDMPDTKQLAQLSELCDEQLLLSKNIQTAEDLLKSLKQSLIAVSEQKIPDLMSELGLKTITLTDGTKLTINTIYRGNINKNNQYEAFAWLRDNEFGDIIRHEVKVDLGKQEDKKAQELIELIVDAGYDPSDKEFVHWATLSAFIKEQIEEGEDIPMDTLGVYIVNKAVLK